MMRTMIAAMLGVAMVVTNFTDRCIYLEKALCEIEKTIYNIPHSLIETPEGYELILYDKEKREVFSMVYSKEPWVCEVAEGVFEIGVSTGSPARYTFYFRREDGKMSSGFFNAKLFGGRYIAYRSWDSGQWDAPLILTDIFEEGILYQEIYRDFSVTSDPMSMVFDGNIEATELLLKIILKKDDIQVISVVGQRELQSPVVGGHEAFQGRRRALDVRWTSVSADRSGTETERGCVKQGVFCSDGILLISSSMSPAITYLCKRSLFCRREINVF